ncbi:hypothetical protein P4U43_08075 [Arthrobacter sp. EH-1B-1]|uniref:Uncharacterized protein n=1 Tax=Arthrobacter vasquezii TaxID=2977629 RepID=A0ABT6CUI7_9MICC|nr:hypothetical protein [Arthrobacter vasquezii]MDF9277744.1 hypothetical protein [Arthrobacter vasquezii]
MALISPKSVERMYGVSTADLARWRQSGEGPEYYRISARLVRYGTDDLDEWFTDPVNAHLHHFPVHEGTLLCPA